MHVVGIVTKKDLIVDGVVTRKDLIVGDRHYNQEESDCRWTKVVW